MQLLDSRILYEIPRGENNPRNSEGSFVRLKDGGILFAYSRYTGSSDHDDAACDIAAVYAPDGEHFGDLRILATAAEHGVQNIMSVTLLRLGNGDIGLFYLIKHDWDGTSSFVLRRSTDEGQTLSEPVQCLPDHFPAYYVVNNDRVLQTSDGRLLIPAALHRVGSFDGKPRMDYRAGVCFFVSDDDGKTFHELGKPLNMPVCSETGLQEPGLSELPGGALYAYFRTDRMCQYESVSLNGGKTWFMPQPSAFSSPASPMKIARNPYTGLYYAVWNPIPAYNGRITDPDEQWISAGRTPLVIAESENGVDFSAPVVLENDPTHGYCYPAICFTGDKEMLLSYCSGGAADGMCLTRTTIRKIVLE